MNNKSSTIGTSLLHNTYNQDFPPYRKYYAGILLVWQGPENDVMHTDNVIKRNQIMLV